MPRSHAALLAYAFVTVAATTSAVACSNSPASPETAPARITISGGRAGLVPGQTLQLSATAYDAAGAVITSPGTFTWSSSLESVATVDPTGKVTVVGAGQTMIRATIGSTSGSYALRIDPGGAAWRGAAP